MELQVQTGLPLNLKGHCMKILLELMALSALFFAKSLLHDQKRSTLTAPQVYMKLWEQCAK